MLVKRLLANIYLILGINVCAMNQEVPTLRELCAKKISEYTEQNKYHVAQLSAQLPSDLHITVAQKLAFLGYLKRKQIDVTKTIDFNYCDKKNSILSVALCQSDYLVFGDNNSNVVRWNMKHSFKQTHFNDHDNARVMSYCGNNRVLVGAGKNAILVHLFDKRLTALLGYHKRYITSVVTVDDYLISAGIDGLIKKWDGVKGNVLNSVRACDDSIRSVVFCNDVLASACSTGYIEFWDCKTFKKLKCFNAHDNKWIESLDYDKKNNILASASYDTSIKLWDLTAGKELNTLTGHTDWVTKVKYLNNNMLASGSRNGEVILWNASTGKQLKTLDGSSKEKITDITYSNDDDLIVSSCDGTIKIWNLKDFTDPSLEKIAALKDK